MKKGCNDFWANNKEREQFREVSEKERQEIVEKDKVVENIDKVLEHYISKYIW